MNILVTGYTGIVGSAVAECLAPNNKLICLVRDGHKRLAEGKLVKTRSMSIINSDITKPNCGLSESALVSLSKINIDKLVHCAASIKFDQKLAKQIWQTNFGGTENVLALARRLSVQEFHYVSTAYAGTERNPYESSKFAAEKAVKQSGLAFSIYSPSVIVGDSKRGRISQFNGFYGCLAGIIKVMAYAKTHGLGSHLPLYIDNSFSSTLNLVPIDWAADVISQLVLFKAAGKSYNIVHPFPPTVFWLYKQTFKMFSITGIRYNYYKNRQPTHDSKKMKVLQRAINSYINVFRPYLVKEAEFTLDQVKNILGSRYAPPREIDKNFLEILINFALLKNFGKAKPLILLE